MLYFDTSFLAPLILEEATSAGMEYFLRHPLPGEWGVQRRALSGLVFT